MIIQLAGFDYSFPEKNGVPHIGAGYRDTVMRNIGKLFNAWCKENPDELETLTDAAADLAKTVWTKKADEWEAEHAGEEATVLRQNISSLENIHSENERLRYSTRFVIAWAVRHLWEAVNKNDPDYKAAVLTVVLTPMRNSPPVRAAYMQADESEVAAAMGFFESAMNPQIEEPKKSD